MRFILLIGLLVVFTACSNAPFSKTLNPHPQRIGLAQEQDVDPVQEQFLAALEQFSTSNQLTLMEDFIRQNPASRWAAYAETIVLYARELDVRKNQLSVLQEEQQQRLAELEELALKNQQLSEKIEQLKSLLIELEARPQ